MREIRDRQADSIEYVLHTHGIKARVDGGKLSPRLTHFRVVLPPGVRPAQISPVVPELADVLGVTACRLAAAEDGIYLEVPRPDPVPIRLLPIVQRVSDVVPPATATLGPDCDSTPLLLRLDSPEVDPVLVSGNPGAGKSRLLRSIVLSLSLHNSPDRLRFLLLDCTGEGAAFGGMDGLPHLATPIANGPFDSLVGLRWALRTLARRVQAAEDEELTFDDDNPPSPSPQGDEPTLIVLVDGADALISNRRAEAEAVESLRRLLSEGRNHGIHLVVAGERADLLLGLGDWKARIAGAVSSPEAARIATGVKGSGAQELLGSGDFLISLNAELIRFQAAAASDSDVVRAIALIRECAETYRQPAEGEPDPEELPFLRNSGPRRRLEPVTAPRPAQPPQPSHQLRRTWQAD